MFGDYGYMEEGQLGKPYNLRLLRRLAPYAAAYRKPIAAALLLTIAITVLDLALPYLSKVAIDRYILSTWYLLPESENESLEKEEKPRFVPARQIKKLATARRKALLGPEHSAAKRYYRIPRSEVQRLSLEPFAGSYLLPGGDLMVPFEWLESRDRRSLLQIRRHDLNGVASIGLLFLAILAVSLALGYAEVMFLEYAGQNIMHDLRMALFDKLQTQGLRFFDHHPLGRLVTRVTNDVENLNEMFKSVMVTVFKDVFILAGILAVLLSLNWRLALLCFLLLPVLFTITFVFSRLAREAFRQLRATVSKINAFLQERLSGMRVVQLFVAEQKQQEVFQRINEENYTAGMRQIRVFAVFMPLMELLASVAVALLIWRGGILVLGEQLTLGALVAFLSYIQMFFKPIRDISEKYNIMQSAMASTERIFEFMDLKPEISGTAVPRRPVRKKGHLVFENVSFAYQPGRPVLQEISFELRPGEMLALVGPTGAGKTTVVSLLQRFYDPQQGRIMLDGVELKEWPLAELRRMVSPCMQDVFLFSGTLEENITLGRKHCDPRAVRQAAAAANALHFISRQPQGLQTRLGEGGGTLSAGERQLLSFTRALAGSPQVLVLDEATSSVDPETERLIQEAVSNMVVRQSTLVVAHRLSTIRQAHRILFLQSGRIREQGTHAQLMAGKGLYYRLARLREEEQSRP